MTTFKVRWEIDIDADTPREAAYQALQIQRDPQSIATVFEVSEPCDWAEQIDLSDPGPVPAFYYDSIDTLEQAKFFLTRLHETGKLFHLEDSPDQVIVSATGQRLFTGEEADLLTRRVDEVFGYFLGHEEDPFAFIMDELLRIDAGDET